MRPAVIVFAVCVLACAIAHLAILRSVIRAAAGRPVEAGVPRSRFGVELVWAVIPMLVLALVLTATWAKVRSQTTSRPESIMEVAR